MPKARFIIAGILLLTLILFIGREAHLALIPTLPKDMPDDARFVQSGWNLEHNEAVGHWVACRPDSDQPVDWCRVTDQRGTVVFEGKFLPTDSPSPLPADQLAIGNLDPKRLWTAGPLEKSPIPVIPLANGRVLVPEADRFVLLERWAHDPVESQKYLEANN